MTRASHALINADASGGHDRTSFARKLDANMLEAETAVLTGSSQQASLK